MSDVKTEKKAKSSNPELEAALARIAELQAKLDAKGRTADDEPKPERVMGKATYRLTKPHYRKGMLYEPGDMITVENEIPGRSWVRVEQADVEATIAAKSASLFAAGRATPAPVEQPNDEV